MKSLEQYRRLLVSDARLEHSVPLSDLLPDIIVNIVLTIHSTPKRAQLALASARNAPTDCRHRPALILKKNALSSALAACGPLPGMFLIVSRAKLERPLQQAPNFGAIAERATPVLFLVLRAKLNAPSALPELGAPQQVKAV